MNANEKYTKFKYLKSESGECYIMADELIGSLFADEEIEKVETKLGKEYEHR